MIDLAGLASEPLIFAVALFAATFVAEDAATIAAGVIVGSSGIDPYLALAAVIAGTAIGDMALYGAGRWGASSAFGAKLRQRADVGSALAAFERRTTGFLVVARFVPGMRLPVFTASGVANVSARLVATIIMITTPIWTAMLFEIARRAGSGAANELVGMAVFAGLVLAAVLILPRRLSRTILRQN